MCVLTALCVSRYSGACRASSSCSAWQEKRRRGHGLQLRRELHQQILHRFIRRQQDAPVIHGPQDREKIPPVIAPHRLAAQQIADGRIVAKSRGHDPRCLRQVALLHTIAHRAQAVRQRNGLRKLFVHVSCSFVKSRRTKQKSRSPGTASRMIGSASMRLALG